MDASLTPPPRPQPPDPTPPLARPLKLMLFKASMSDSEIAAILDANFGTIIERDDR